MQKKQQQIFSILIKKIEKVDPRDNHFGGGGMMSDMDGIINETILVEIDLSAEETIDLMSTLASKRGAKDTNIRLSKFRN